MSTLFLELLYLDKYAEYRAGTDPNKIDCEIKFRFYYDHFKQNFNYGFGMPRSDVCCVCTEIEAKIKVEKKCSCNEGPRNKAAFAQNEGKRLRQEVEGVY